MEFKHCNAEACAPQAADGLLKCSAKLDVVILLDGSASIGPSGWEATKTAAKTLITNLEGTAPGQKAHAAQVAVLLFSGPTTWDGFKKCTTSAEGVNMETDCKISWVNHLSADTHAVAGRMDGLTWPQGATLTSAALANAGTELLSGRADAAQVIITITDGKPMNTKQTTQVTDSLKHKGIRLMWVPVTGEAPVDEIKKWASLPVADNVLALADYEQLPWAETMNKIMADICPTVS